MFKKQYPIQIWFLDADLQKSASYLTNKLLCKTINGCVQALLSTYMYMNGIKNSKFQKYFFDKDHIDDTMEKYFQNWPFKNKPKVINFNSKENKWTRKCKEHFDYIKLYLEYLLIEYEYRFNKSHILHELLDFLVYNETKLKYANLKTIVLPWKALNPKYRRKNIVEGYQMQYKNFILKNNLLDDFLKTKRDTPDFITQIVQIF